MHYRLTFPCVLPTVWSLLFDESLLSAGFPNLKFDEAIRAEHCEKVGHNIPFKTSNYDLTSTPEREFEIATTGKVGGKDVPKKDLCDKNGNEVRVIRSMEDLKRLPLVIRSGLKPYEILCVVRTVLIAIVFF
jgi:hypothetical protein